MEFISVMFTLCELYDGYYYCIHKSQRSQWSLPWSADLSGLGVGLGVCVRVGEGYTIEVAANKVYSDLVHFGDMLFNANYEFVLS